MRRSRAALAVSMSLALLATAPRALADADVGAWETLVDFPNLPVHVMHLHPTDGGDVGRYLMWNGHYSSSVSIDSWIWTPTLACFQDFGHCNGPLEGPTCEVDQCMDYLENQNTNVFCAGHSALEDGTILVAGGHYEGTGNNVGLEATNLFRPSSSEWLGLADGVPNMTFPRWYPTVTTLGDGRALVVSGSHSLCSGGDRNGLWCENLPCPDGTCSPSSVCVYGSSGNPQIGDPCTTDADCPTDGQDQGYCGGVCDGGANDGVLCDCPDSGTCQFHIVDVPEVYDPVSVTWTALPLSPLALAFYPFMFLLPSGQVFMAGSETPFGSAAEAPQQSFLFDVDLAEIQNAWQVADFSASLGGSAVMFEPGMILKSGGLQPDLAGDPVPSTTIAEVIDMTAGGDEMWHPIANMNHARVRHNLTTLPDGTILASGGASVNTNLDVDKVLAPELYDPQLDTWTDLPEMAVGRMYHSTTMLMPDARVFSAGGGQGGGADVNHANAEIYSPAYMFRGPHPVISSAPQVIEWGTALEVTSPQAGEIEKAVLIGLGATTHAFDQHTRRLSLTILDVTGDVITLDAPPDSNHAPAGYYMLFILSERHCVGGERDGELCTINNDDAVEGCPDLQDDPGSCTSGGVPSHAKYVQITDAICAPKTQGFWRRQCAGPHPSGEHEMLPDYLSCVAEHDVFSDFVDTQEMCEALNPQDVKRVSPTQRKCLQAESQLMALALSICSGRVSESCCVDSADSTSLSVHLAVLEAAELLADQNRTFEDCEQAQAIADSINTGEGLCVVTDDEGNPLPDPFACGLGFSLVFLLPPLMWAHRRWRRAIR